MDIHFTTSLQNRKILYQIIKNTPREVLFAIPEGYNNNIWWNIAHIVVTQQGLFYGLTGQAFTVDKELIKKYRKGTRPEENPSDDEIQTVSQALFQTVETAWEDYQDGKFKNFNPYETSNKVTLATIEDAVAFNSFHEGLHLGVVLSLLKTCGVKIRS